MMARCDLTHAAMTARPAGSVGMGCVGVSLSRRGRVGALLMVIAASGCAAPAIVFEGKQCGADNLCPEPLRCVRTGDSADGICRLPATEPLPDAGATSLHHDPFEGPFLDTETPAGVWNIFNPTTVNSANLTAAAAHRGSSGLRHTDLHSDEPNPGSGGAQLTVQTDIKALSDRWYVRTWLRTNDVKFNGTGDRTLMNLRSGAYGSRPHICELRLRQAGQEAVLGGFDGSGEYGEVALARPLPAGEWHLIELAVENVGTAQGRCALWVDGELAGERTGLNWVGARVDTLAIGQPWALDRSFTGTTDFDDLALSSAPNATRLALELPTLSQVDGCAPVRLTLEDAQRSAVAAPYPLDVALTVSGGADALFEDASCARATAGVEIAQGESGAVFYVRPRTAEPLLIAAAHADFFPGTLEDAVSSPPDSPTGCASAPGSLLPFALLLPFVWIRRVRTKQACRACVFLLLTVLLRPGSAEASSGLDEAIRQIRALEPEAALKTLERERGRADIGPRELASVHLYAGLAYAQLANIDRAVTSFRSARLLDPSLELPEPASPAVRDLWATTAPAATESPRPTTDEGSQRAVADTEAQREIVSPVPTVPATEPSASRGGWRAALGWGLLASGVAAAAGGVYFGAQLPRTAEAARQEPDVGRALILARESQAQARTANVLFGVSGVLALGGGVLIAF